MKVLCIGAGAVGGSVASRLRKSGVEVVVTDANREHVELIRGRGLRVDSPEGTERVVLDATGELDHAHLAEADLVLLAVRSADTEAALQAVVPHLRDDADVVSLQNGLNEDRIAELVGPSRTMGCVVGFGATWIEPGHIEVNTEGDLVLGRLDGAEDERLQRARDVLDLAFPTKVTGNITGALWAKMLVNSMTVLGALGGMLTGELLATSERRRIVAGVVAEGVRVARSEGVQLPPVFGRVPPELVDDQGWYATMDKVLARVGEAFGTIKSVTWRDFELGRTTEIDAVTGEIVARGRARGVDVPLSSAAYDLLKEIEAGRRVPREANLAALASA